MAINIQPRTSALGTLARVGATAMGGYGQGYANMAPQLMQARPSGVAAGNAAMAPLMQLSQNFVDTYRQSFGTFANLASQEQAQQARITEQNTAHKFALESLGVEGKMRVNDWALREYNAPLTEGDPRFGVPGQPGYVPSLEKQYADVVSTGKAPATLTEYMNSLDQQKKNEAYQMDLRKRGLMEGLLPAEEAHNTSIYAAQAQLRTNPSFIDTLTQMPKPEYYDAVRKLDAQIIPKHPIPIGQNVPAQERYMTETVVDPGTGKRVTKDQRAGVWKEVFPQRGQQRSGAGAAGPATPTGGAVNDFVNMTMTGSAMGQPVADTAQQNQIQPFAADPDLDVVLDGRGNPKIDHTRAQMAIERKKLRMDAMDKAYRSIASTSADEAVDMAKVKALAKMYMDEDNAAQSAGPATPQESAEPNIPDLMPLPKDPTKLDQYEVGKVYPFTRNGRRVYGRIEKNGTISPVNP